MKDLIETWNCPFCGNPLPLTEESYIKCECCGRTVYISRPQEDELSDATEPFRPNKPRERQVLSPQKRRGVIIWSLFMVFILAFYVYYLVVVPIYVRDFAFDLFCFASLVVIAALGYGRLFPPPKK